MPATTYRRPDRLNFLPQQNARAIYNPEIDTGRGETTLLDGRPVLIEDWHDVEMGLDLRTFFYSQIDIEQWEEAQHLEALVATGYLKGYNDYYRGAGITTLVDASGQNIWSVTVTKNSIPD